MKFIPAMSLFQTHMRIIRSIQRVCAYTFLFENLMPIWNFISVKMTDMKSIPVWVSFIWTQVKSWLNTDVKFSTEMKSCTGLSSPRLSCERTLDAIKLLFWGCFLYQECLQSWIWMVVTEKEDWPWKRRLNKIILDRVFSPTGQLYAWNLSKFLKSWLSRNWGLKLLSNF